MKILALEFSSSRRSAAVAEAFPAGVEILGSVTAENTRTVTGMELIDRALSGARLEPSDIDVIAVGLGPGSYVGIRSAIALAQGWQLARETQLLGISSVEVMAKRAQESGVRGSVTIIIDAQRQEVYAAKYALDPTHFRMVEPLRIYRREEMIAGPMVGPEASTLVPGATDLYPEAAGLARLAAARTDYRCGEELEPIYLRESSFVKAPPPRFLT